MKKLLTVFIALLVVAGCSSSEQKWDKTAQPAINGLQLPAGFEDWKIISVSYRTDRNSIRAIMGNDKAVEAARTGNTNPYPDGAIVGKVAWQAVEDEAWPDAIVPEELLVAEFMYKDSKEFASNGTGWGWARWLGKERKPYGETKDLSRNV